ncbi:MAG TPA: hypothetical protein VEI02_05520, partial [Planctomycetota bacterium]|nr:hypothetical protein [Planctomycetota bacterium]
TGLTPTTTTMRVALGYGLANPQPACGAVNYGDREDYLVTIAPPFELVMSSPLGAGSLQVNINNGTPNAPYFMAVALAAGAFPNGWFFGVDIPLNDLVNEYIAGPPFIGLLDASGNFQFGPFPGLPSGLTLYAVAVDQLFTPISRATNPVAYTIP